MNVFINKFLNRTVIKDQIIRSISINSAFTHVNEDKLLKSWKNIPGPTTLPVIGQILHFILPGGLLYNRKVELAQILYENYGPLVRVEGGIGMSPVIFIYDPEVALNIFRNENETPVRPGFDALEYFRKFYYSRKDNPWEETTGLITEHGEPWKKFRSTVNPILLQPKNIKMYTDALNQVAEDMVNRIRSKRNEKNMLNAKFNTEMTLWAMEAIGVVALGSRLNCFDPNLAKDSPAMRLINATHYVFYLVEKLDFEPSLWKYISTPVFKAAMKCFDEHTKLNEYFVEKAIEQLKNYENKEKDKDKEKGILVKLLEIDHNIAVIMASDMLFAAIDTTANTTIASLLHLAQNPEKQNKLREEIKSKDEKKQYLKACIKESLRLMPVVGGNFRKTTKEYNVMGYKIPKDMFVIFANQYLCSWEEQFPRAKEFIPERWIVNRNDPLYYGQAHPFVYCPFGFGSRSCIGKRIAELEMETVIAKIIENFRVGWIGPPPVPTRTSIVNHLIKPYNFTFEDI
ncbi:cytochrome P450 CYP12A2-like isoform X1 [Maniola jurtina]|uniref:cytochrome P450 CYP12A2-like isoform X1 n=1 Tax=Maniola jurtina TaxID=191418 RepID=UPI001E68F5F1|nr:cytochrome P450 CYP12A2-like isoform X1 [Maniola jurtina]